MQQVLRDYNKDRQQKNRPPLRTGIGLNTGQLMLGIIGDQNRYDSAVTTDFQQVVEDVILAADDDDRVAGHIDGTPLELP